MTEDAYIGIGSNLGDRVHACLFGIRELHRLPYTRVMAVSSLYETEPVGTGPSPWFVNTAVLVKTNLPAAEILRACLKIEASVGRVRVAPGEPRPLDIDLLLYGGRLVVEEGVTVPHPRMTARRFVLVPLAEIDRNVVHPLLNKTIGTLLQELEDSRVVRRLQEIDLDRILAA